MDSTETTSTLSFLDTQNFELVDFRERSGELSTWVGGQETHLFGVDSGRWIAVPSMSDIERLDRIADFSFFVSNSELASALQALVNVSALVQAAEDLISRYPEESEFWGCYKSQRQKEAAMDWLEEVVDMEATLST